MITRQEAMLRVLTACGYEHDGTNPLYGGGETADVLIALGASRDELDAVAVEADGFAGPVWAGYFRCMVGTVARPDGDPGTKPAVEPPAAASPAAEPALFDTPGPSRRALKPSVPPVQRRRSVRSATTTGDLL